MRMSANTMQRNGVVLACVRELQSRNVELLVNVTGFSTSQVEKALASLEKQNLLPNDEEDKLASEPEKPE